MLSRDKILDAALKVAREEGLGGLSQRKLAKELGVSAMAMYRHFRDKDALVHALLDHVIAPDVLLAHRSDDIEESLIAVFTDLRALFLREPALAPLAGTPASLGANGLRFLNGLMGWLMETSELQADDATLLVHHALNYTLGASMIAAGAKSTDGLAAARTRFAGLDVGDYPALVKAAPSLLGFVSDEMFDRGLRRIIHSLVAR